MNKDIFFWEKRRCPVLSRMILLERSETVLRILRFGNASGCQFGRGALSAEYKNCDGFSQDYIRWTRLSLVTRGLTSGGKVLRSKLVDERCPVQSPSHFSTYPFGVFHGFLWNSRKYGLGYHRKTLTEGTSPKIPGPTSRQLALILQPNPLTRVCNSNHNVKFT